VTHDSSHGSTHDCRMEQSHRADVLRDSFVSVLVFVGVLLPFVDSIDYLRRETWIWTRIVFEIHTL
jgi:hypothetical protein